MLPQITLTFLLALTLVDAVPPVGHKRKPDKLVELQDPPKYEYEYKIQHGKGAGQGKSEIRDGKTSGSYYVEGKDSSQKVEYVADDLGYHPYVEYTHIGPHSKTVTQIALDTASLKTMKSKHNTQIPGTEALVSSKPKRVQQNVLSYGHQNHRNYGKSSGASYISVQQQNPPTAQAESSAAIQQEDLQQKQEQQHHEQRQPHLQQEADAALQQQQLQLQQVNALEQALQQLRFPIHPHQEASVVHQGLQQVNAQNQGQNVIYLQPQQFNDILQQTIQNNAIQHQKQQELQQQRQLERQQQQLELQQQQLHEQQQQQLLEQQHQEQQKRQQQEQLKRKQQQEQERQQQQEQERQQRQEQERQQQQEHERQQENERQQQQRQQQQQLQVVKFQEQEQHHNDVEQSQSQQQTAATAEQSGNRQQAVLIPIQQQAFPSHLGQYGSPSGSGGIVLLQQQPGVHLIPHQQQQQQQVVSVSPSPSPIQSQNVEQKDEGIQISNYAPNLEEQAQILLQGGHVTLGYGSSQRQQDLVFLQNALNQPAGNLLLQQLRYDVPAQPTSYPVTQQPPPVIILQKQGLNDKNQQQHSNSKPESHGQNSIHFETAALYESSGNKLIGQQNNYRNTNTKEAYDESLRNVENPGGYGSKLNVKITPNSRPLKFLQAVKRLVTGQDVLNINGAVNQNLDGGKPESTTAATAIVSEYAPSEVSNLVSSGPEVVIGGSTYRPRISSTTENLIHHGERIKVSTEESPVTQDLALSKQPIIVADLEYYRENGVDSSTKSYSEEVAVTPRPVSSKFLAPLTAGVQLQAEENQDEPGEAHQNIVVDIQKSIPYYLGKIEYYDGANEFKNKDSNFTVSATQNILLGGFLQHPIQEPPKAEALVQKQPDSQKAGSSFSQSLSSPDHEVSESIQQAPHVQALDNPGSAKTTNKPVVVADYINKPYAVRVAVVEKPVEITKYVDKPYPVHVPVHIPVQVPVTVEKHVPVPYKVEVEKIVEKPVTVTKIVEKKVPVTHTVEKRVEVPVHVTKYIDRPYAVPVAVPSPVPYPVEIQKVVEKIVKQPYPVEVRVPVQVPVRVPVAHPVQVTIEKKVPVPQYIEKPVPQYIPKPYPVAVGVPVQVAQAFYVPVQIQKPYPEQVPKYTNTNFALPKPYQVQLAEILQVPGTQTVPLELQAPQPSRVPVLFKNEYNLKPPKAPGSGNGEPLAYAASYQSSVRIPCVDLRHLGVNKPVCATMNNNNYIGLVPPKLPMNLQNQNGTINAVRKQRTAKQSFDESNIRLEYGFMPPLIPSLAIDEEGNPVEKHTK